MIFIFLENSNYKIIHSNPNNETMLYKCILQKKGALYVSWNKNIYQLLLIQLINFVVILNQGKIHLHPLVFFKGQKSSYLHLWCQHDSD